MKTVYDLIRHRTALEVFCTNCTNAKVVNNLFLTNRFGMMKLLLEIDFVCHRCQSRRYRLRFVPDHLGEIAPLRIQWFRGVYEKSLD
jgi:hypothetical protein